jgi:integrase/recombinase XerD
MQMRRPWEITREMFLSFDEVDALLTHVRARAAADSSSPAEQLDRLIIESLLFSGLRNSEFCRLRVADTIIGTRQSAFRVCVGTKVDRAVFVPQQLSDLVCDYIRATRPTLLAAKSVRSLDAPLILNERGNAYERTGLYRRVIRILAEAGLGDRASVQLLRHTYGYLAYARGGGNLLFVQRQMGHAHPMVTSIYAQFVDESYAAIAEQLAAPNDPGPEPTKRRRRPSRIEGGYR